MSPGTYVFESLTSSIACSKECRGGVAVDVVEDVCDFDGCIQSLGGAWIVGNMRHTMASLRAAVIAKASLILSGPRREASCVGEAGINMLGRKWRERR